MSTQNAAGRIADQFGEIKECTKRISINHTTPFEEREG